MAKNEFLTFGIAEGANVLSNEEYAALAARVNGFSAGVAKSRELNKAWRQSSIITHILAQYIADESGNDVLDNGDIDALKKSLAAAIKNALPEVRDATLTEKGIIQLSNATDSTSEKLAATPRAVKYAYDLANSANTNANTKLSKSQNGADIPDKNAFVKNLGLSETVELARNAVPGSRKINGKALTGDVSLSAGDVGACRAYSGSINTGDGTWTTKEFIVWLKQNGAFDNPYWICKGSWSYADNRIINDTGCGNICLAGAVVEVMGVESATTIRITTPTTASGNGIPDTQFTYTNNGKEYRPGWRRDYTKDEVDSLIVPVGVPLPYPHRYTPAGYLTCNGQTFDKSRYPKLAEAYPSGRVPDLRGEFIRGWDDSRGVDPGRACGSWQADSTKRIQLAEGYGNENGHLWTYQGAPGGLRYPLGRDAMGNATATSIANNTGGNETRPRNIAFNYIVRAA
ncbi:phage tail protein [Photorhabdus sp. RM323S]|uniref:phage tail protein n=1 Tax=Photorhabdus sp. RM323S TaxID=3342828 RepID=UPI0036DC10F3